MGALAGLIRFLVHFLKEPIKESFDLLVENLLTCVRRDDLSARIEKNVGDIGPMATNGPRL
jgi:hypothetical protein